MDLKKLLNEEQILPVEATEGPVLVFAGAGSGKTRVLTYRIAHLIELGVSPYNILAITFTNKAAKEMQERIEKVTGVTGMQISTFHSFCTKILRQDIEALGIYTKNFTIYDDDDSQKVMNRIVKDYKLEDEKASQLVKEIMGHVSMAKNYGFNPKTYYVRIASHPRARLICNAFNDYQETLVKNNALDFDDLLLLTATLFSKCPDVLEKYQRKYQYIHVDEFQDTNAIQYLLLRMLGQKYQNVFVVGDDDQSIYGWRGADYTNIKKFQEQFLGTKIFKLQRNYRSTKNILDVANKIIQVNKERAPKSLWTDSSQGMRVECKKADNEDDEADYIIGQIQMLLRQGGYKYNDFAILVRTTSITRSIEQKLNLYGLPFRMIGGHKFFQRKEIKDFLAYLQIISNPKADEPLLRVINLPRRGIGDIAIESLQEICKARGLSLGEGIRKIREIGASDRIVKKFEEFSNILNCLDAKKLLPLNDIADYIAETIDFKSAYTSKGDDGQNKMENIDSLLSDIKEYCSNNPNTSIDEYLQQVAIVSYDDKDDPLDNNKITVATVHGVKGLEYKVVFIMGLEEGIFPTKRVDSTEKNIEEERRIMYVAVTRAKEILYLTYANSRFRYGRREQTIESEFIMDAGLSKKMHKPLCDDDPIYRQMQKSSIDYLKLSQKSTPAFAMKKDASNIGKDISKFKVGMKVSHPRFGEGIIKEISGENADIEFDGLGVKKFNMRLAPLTIIE